MEFEQLKLSNQLCFPIYAASRLITKKYQPLLDELGITYPQYLVLMVLWEENRTSVNAIAQKLLLNTNTVTPLLKRMEVMGIIERKRSESDERKVMVSLSEKGDQMRYKAAEIPAKLVAELSKSSLSMEQLIELRTTINELINFLQKED